MILAFNAHPIIDGSDLRNRVAEAPIGNSVALRILRAGKPVVLNVVMEEAPGN